MPGTILLDDLRDSVGEQLRQHVDGLVSAGQQALITVTSAAPQVEAPDRDAILQQLQQHVQQVVQPVEQPALQVLGGAQQAAGGALQQIGQSRDQVAQQLQQHVDDITQQQPGLQSLAVPAAPPPPQPVHADVTAPDHAPSPPLQTPGTQIANTPDATGRVFPLTIKPDNAPSATYHSQGGSDLMAPRGTPVLNMQAGRVEEVFTDNGSHTVGGNAVLVHGDDGLDYYYAHFDQPSAVKVGQRVDTGEQIGAVGNSGNAYKGGTGETHLHIGIGHGISNGVGSEGGLGQNFNAQSLLTNLESGIGQAAGAARAAVQNVAGDIQARVGQGQKDFVNTLQPLAQRVAQQTGIDPNAMLAIAANETGWGQSSNAQQQNNLFSIQGDGSNGSRWASYKSPQDSFNAFVHLISSAPRYAQAWADRADPTRFVDDLRHAGYVADEPGFPAQGWVDQVKSIYRNLPVVGGGQADSGGASAQRQAAVSNEPITIAGQAAKAPLYVHGAMQDAAGNELAGQQAPAPTPIQSAADVVGRATEGARGVVGQAASDLGTAAQGALGAAGEAIGGALGGAGQAIGGALGGAGEAIGGAASDLGTGVSHAYGLDKSQRERDEFAQRQLEETQRLIDEQNRRAQEPMTPQSVASGVLNILTGATPSMGVTWEDYRQQQDVKNQWLEQNNPARDLPVIGGLTTAIAQQLSDPLMVGTFGPTLALGRTVGLGAGEAAASAAASRLSPAATRFLSTVAGRVTTGGIVNGLQQALFEAEKPDATPQAVGQALLSGAALGAGIDLGAPAVATVVRRIGQQVIDRAAEIRPGDLAAALRTRQRAEGINPFSPPARLPAEAAPVVRGEVPTTADVTAQMHRNFLRDQVRAPKSDPRPQVQDMGLANEKLVDQNNLTDVVPAGTTVLYHETSVPNARALLDRIESGPRNQTPIFTSDNRDLALGQGGKGVMLEFDPARANGGLAPQKPGLTFTAATGGGQEYTVSKTLPGAVSAIVVRTERQAAQLATNARVARRFDFANAEPTADGGIRIPRREATAAPAVQAGTGFTAPDTVPANPYRLEQTPPTADARPMTSTELSDHFDALAQRHDEVADRILSIQDQLAAGRGARPDRPPWGAGYTNEALQTIARQHGVSAFEENWWEKAGLLSGSGEVRENVGESGLRGTGKTVQRPSELRAELRQLEAEQGHLHEAANDLTSANDATVFYRRPSGAAADLPFEYPATDVRAAEPAEPVEPLGGGEAAPRAGEGAAAPRADTGGARAPEPPPDAAPARPTGRTELSRATPELDKLNAMYEGKKPAPAASIPDRIQAVGDSLTRAFTDRQVDINRAQERYAANLGRPLRGDEMAAELQRLASDPAAQVKVDEGLKPAIQAVGKDYPALRNYVTLRSNIEIADNLATRTGKPEVGAERSFSGGLTRDESVKAMRDLEQQLGPERFATVKAAADQVTAFNKSLRERLVQAGVLDEGTAADLEAQYPNWAKTRILDYMADPTGGQGAGTKIGLSDRGLREYTLKGTERAREDPVASTVAYAHQVERMAMKNEAFQAFLKIDQAGDTPMLREVPQSYTPKSNEVTMIGFVDGEKQKFVTDNKALGAAINGAGVMSTPEWTSAWQKIFRSLATSRNPLFLAGNAALDIPTYVLRSSVREGGPQALPRILYELARGYGDAFQGLLQGEFRGEGTSEFLKGGGGQSGYFTGGEGQSKRAVAEMQRNNVFQINGAQDMWRLTKDLLTLHPVEALGERIELGPRVAAMRLAERRGENATKAIIDGRTVTVDFSQGGTVTKYLNNFIPFFNVGFQGPAQIARAFRDNPRAFVATVGTLLGVPSAAAEVWNRSDPQRAKDYADVPQYVKDQGVVIMLPGEAPVDKQGNRKPMYAVIKLREWAPFAAIAREATDRALGDDSRSWQEMASSTLSGFSPIQAQNVAQVGTEPLAGIPILPAAAQLGMNTDFFRGRTIVTQRADENASAFAKALTPAIQQVVDRAGINAEIRPSAIDFLVRNQGAGVGGAALSASDLAAGEPSDVAGPTGTPVVGGLIGRFEGNQTGDALQQARDRTLTAEGRQTLRSNGITLTPGAVSGSVNQIPLNLEEETRYQQLTNQYIDQAIQRTAASADFATKTQVGKQSLMDQAMQAARQKAGIEVLNTIAAAEKQRRLRTKSTAPAAA